MTEWKVGAIGRGSLPGMKRLIDYLEQRRSESMEGQINLLVQQAHQNATSKGWWEEDRSFGEIIALMHSELSEALEDYRAGKRPNEMWYEQYDKDDDEVYVLSIKPDEPDWKPCGIPSELADVVIRVFDACGRYGIDLEQAIKEKMAYNATRPHKHGGKKI